MNGYDAWKLQTPEEYFGAVTKTCEWCGDDFDTYDKDDEICDECWEDRGLLNYKKKRRNANRSL